MAAAPKSGSESRTRAIFAALLGVALTSDPALAQGQRKGDASIRVEYQHVRTGTFKFDLGELDYWSTDTHALLIAGNYAISDRLTLFGSLPYVRKRFNSLVPWGGDPHDPNDPWWIDFVPPDRRNWDDGDYHGAFQDLSIGASYIAREGPLTIAPFISIGVPVSDYPFYAKAAIGKNLRTLSMGVSSTYVPYFSDWHFDGSLAYVFSEKPVNTNVDYSLLNLSAGYWIKPNISVNVFLVGKYTWQGFQFSDFVDDVFTAVYPDDFDTEEWWNHDRLYAARSLNFGAGLDYSLNENYQVSARAITGLFAETTTDTGFAFSLAVTRYFGGKR